jgi:hypothetical protein
MISGSQLPQGMTLQQLQAQLQGLNGTPFQGQGQGALATDFNSYNQAFQQIAPEEQAALGQFNVQSGDMANQAVGSLNSRGLGNSLLGTNINGQQTSGYGSGALQQLAQQRLMGQNQLQQGYTNEANQLNNSMMGDANGIGNYYQQLGMQQQKMNAQQQSQEFNPMSAASLALSIF